MENELLGLLRKKKEHADKEALVSMVSSAAAEALSGDTGGEIAGYGAGLSQDRMGRRDKLEDMSLGLLMSKEKAKTTPASSRRFQFVPVQDEQGNIKIAKGDRATGDLEVTDYKKGLSPFIGRDPKTEELTRITKADSGPVAKSIESKGVTKAPFTVKEEKDLRKVRSNLEKNKLYQASTNAISQSNRAIELLSAGNPIADEGIKTIFPRMFGEVGNLAAQEQERFSGSPELTRKFDKLRSRYLQGVLSAEDRSDLLEVARMMAAYDRRQLRKIVSNEIKSERAVTGMSKKEIEKVIEPLISMPGFSQKSIKNIRRKPIEGNVVQKFYKGKMRRFKKVKGGWEAID